MRFLLHPRYEAQTVYSDRKPLKVEPGETIETDDPAVIARLQNDYRFTEAKAKRGWPKKVRDDGHRAQAKGA